MSFFNQAAFDDPSSRARAKGADLSGRHDIVDVTGRALATITNGGIAAPVRHELPEGTIVFRFGTSSSDPKAIVRGAWWLERQAFDHVRAFAEVHNATIGLAMRLLCLIPPEWGDLGRLVRARVVRPLLAFRGIGDSVLVEKRDGHGAVRMPALRNVAARRVHQLFVPGLQDVPLLSFPLVIEETWTFPTNASNQGWIYT